MINNWKGLSFLYKSFVELTRELLKEETHNEEYLLNYKNIFTGENVFKDPEFRPWKVSEFLTLCSNLSRNKKSNGYIEDYVYLKPYIDSFTWLINYGHSSNFDYLYLYLHKCMGMGRLDKEEIEEVLSLAKDSEVEYISGFDTAGNKDLARALLNTCIKTNKSIIDIKYDSLHPYK